MYTSRNFLSRVVEIQDIVLEHSRRGSSNEWIFLNIIEPKYHISRSTYYNYLAINAKKLLKDIENEKV